MKWISVKDTMPQPEQYDDRVLPWSDVVLVVVEFQPDDHRKGPDVWSAQWNFHNACWCNLEGSLLIDAEYQGKVTHWMPLPAPPVESTGGHDG